MYHRNGGLRSSVLRRMVEIVFVWIASHQNEGVITSSSSSRVAPFVLVRRRRQRRDDNMMQQQQQQQQQIITRQHQHYMSPPPSLFLLSLPIKPPPWQSSRSLLFFHYHPLPCFLPLILRQSSSTKKKWVKRSTHETCWRRRQQHRKRGEVVLRSTVDWTEELDYVKSGLYLREKMRVDDEKHFFPKVWSENDIDFMGARNSTPVLSSSQTKLSDVLSKKKRIEVRLGMKNVFAGFGKQQVLRGCTWHIKSGECVGLVGQNGVGKTTLLRVAIKDLEPRDGEIIRIPQDLRLAFLNQEFRDSLNEERTLREEFEAVVVKDRDLLKYITQVEQSVQVVASNSSSSNSSTVVLLKTLEKLHDQASQRDSYSVDSRIHKVITMMGFSKTDLKMRVRTFSGGWKMRIGLGRLLLQEPDILLLDEPTNHLDLDAVEWVEGFIQLQKIPCVIISHDREFLDRVCNKVVDLESGTTISYQGNYSSFITQRATRLVNWQRDYDKQCKKIKEANQIIQSCGADNRAEKVAKANQKQKYLNNIEQSEDYIATPPPRLRRFRFRFPLSPFTVNDSIEIRSMSHGYPYSGGGVATTRTTVTDVVEPDKRNLIGADPIIAQTSNEEKDTGWLRLFENTDLRVRRKERIAIVGPNGSGKSTLLRLIMGEEKPQSGTVTLLGRKPSVSYFRQNQAEEVDSKTTVFGALRQTYDYHYGLAAQGEDDDKNDSEDSTTMTNEKLRSLLNRFMFGSADLNKPVVSLSGGEKARLALSKMLIQPAKLLVLDEPTNHLDLTARETLEEALQHFDGTILLVSHDRYFVSQVATSIVALENKKLVRYDTDFKTYMLKHNNHLKQKVERLYMPRSTGIRNAPTQLVEMKEREKKAVGPPVNPALIAKRRKTFCGKGTSSKIKGIKNLKRWAN